MMNLAETRGARGESIQIYSALSASPREIFIPLRAWRLGEIHSILTMEPEYLTLPATTAKLAHP